MICPECHNELTNEKDCYGHDCEVPIKRKLTTRFSVSVFRRMVEMSTDEDVILLLKEYSAGEFIVENKKIKPMASGSKTLR